MRATFGEQFFPTAAGYMECFTAGGKRLGGSNLRKALEAFGRLPEEERRPGAVKVGDLDPVDAAATPPEPPPGGMILKVHVRFLKRGADGSLARVTRDDFPLMAGRSGGDDRVGYLFEAHQDHAWFTREEVAALVPEGARKGDRLPVPEGLARRIARFHLVPKRIWGEGGEWGPKAVRAAEMALVVEESSAAAARVRIEGRAKLGSEFDTEKATTPNGPLSIGYEAELSGAAEFDRARKAFMRFDMVALGDAWGRMGDANNNSVTVERPGRNPLGVAFELVTGERPADRLVPTGRASKFKSIGYFSTR